MSDEDKVIRKKPGRLIVTRSASLSGASETKRSVTSDRATSIFLTCPVEEWATPA